MKNILSIGNNILDHSENQLLYLTDGFPENLWLWLRADKGITKDVSNKVSKWVDQSSNAFEFIQPTYSEQPIFSQNSINGKPSLLFVNSALLCALAIKSQPLNWFIVFKMNSYSAAGFVFDDYVSYNANISYRMFLGNYRLKAPSETSFSQAIPDPFNITELRINGGYATILRNKVVKKESAYVGGSGHIGLRLGAHQQNTTYRLNGAIAEILVFDGILSEEDQSNIYQYLSFKYSI